MRASCVVTVTCRAAILNALTVEDGTGEADSTSYISLGEADELIHCLPEADDWESLTFSKKKCALETATFYLDTKFRYYGQTKTTTQRLQWPRTKNYDSRGIVITPGTIPSELKEAQARLAAKWAADPDSLQTEVGPSGAVKSVASGGTSITFDTAVSINQALLGTRYPEIELLLAPIGEFILEGAFTGKDRVTSVRR